jgi:hypothetical protein
MHGRPIAVLLLIPLFLFGKDSVPKLRSIQVAPGDFALTSPWARQRILVTGQLAAGGVRDLTNQTQFKSANGKVVKVDKSGVATPVADGETTISVSVGGQKQKLHVTVRGSREKLASFLQNVEPLLATKGCNSAACHGSGAGQGGLKLSLFSGDPAADYDALARAAGGRRIDRADPLQSLLFLKATGALPHAGGAILKPGTAEYEMLASWLERGAPNRDDQDAQIVSLKLYPEARTLQKGETQQLLATAVFSDGSVRDVTRDANFRSSDPKVASLDAATVKAEGLGDAGIVVTYQRKAAVLRVAVPQTGPQPFPEFPPANPIDTLVYAKLKAMGIPPSGLSTDAEFLRRVYLDVIGILPAAAETRAFLTSTDPDRRAKLIDSLLARDEFADFWSLKWGDLLRIKSEFPVRLWPKAVAVYYEWVHESIAADKPYDQFARELLTANGSNFRDAPTNFVRANPTRDARTLGETAALVFMGARIGCAHCHSHPLEAWTPDDDLALGSYFSRVNFKSTVEWKEEIVYPDFKLSLRNPRTRQVVLPQMPGGKPLQVGPEEDPRAQFATWLTAPDNPWFSANIVNRIWFWLLGRGIVNEPDDLRSTNLPTNPELLSYLQEELKTHKYDLKYIYRLILNSRTYQLSSQPNAWNAADSTHFSHYLVKRLSAEQMLDAVSQFTETNEKFRSIIPEPFSNWPANYRATQISDGNTECSFLDLFGRASRDMPYEADRDNDLTLRQTLYFLNSEQLEGKIGNSPHIKRLLAANKPDSEIVDEIYLTTLSRLPTADERKRLLDYLAAKKTARAQAVQDVAWAVLNAKEFLFNH